MTPTIASRSASVVLALSTLSSVALAEPVELTEAQMDQVTAGAFLYDSAGNLTDIYGFVYTYDSATGLYHSADGWVWEAPNGIYYAEAGRHAQTEPTAYGWLINWESDLIWDGGFQTVEPTENGG
jgi:hypothetical protein